LVKTLINNNISGKKKSFANRLKKSFIKNISGGLGTLYILNLQETSSAFYSYYLLFPPLADMNNHNIQQNCKMENISCCDYS